jgi:hypothetical protein
MLRIIKKTGLNTGYIYALLGVKHQNITRWRANPGSSLTKSGLKYDTIIRAGELFALTDTEIEGLANKAGLSLHHIRNVPAFPNPAPDNAEVSPYADFMLHFGKIIREFPGTMRKLCESALVSERMLRYIRMGRHIKKEPVLALLIAMNLCVNGIQECLKKAGFILSKSLPGDSVIMWMLANEPHRHDGTSIVYRINEVLDSLGLALLMTRAKSE